MSNIKVVDLNEEEPSIQNEEVKEELTEVVNEEVTETHIQNEITNKNILDIDKEVSEAKIEEKPKEIIKMQDKMVTCPKCNKYLKLKSYRYGHEQKCTGSIETKPVKPFSKPRAKPKPKPVAEEITEDVINEVSNTVKERVITNVVNSIQSNPISNLAQHYQLLQQEYIKQKQEKYNNLCQNMFSSKSKKR